MSGAISGVPDVSVGMVLLCGPGSGECPRQPRTEGQHPRRSGVPCSPWVPLRLMVAQGGPLTRHMSSHMADKNPGTLLGTEMEVWSSGVTR